MKIYRIKQGSKCVLGDFDPEGESEFAGNKELCLQHLQILKQEIAELQRVFYAEQSKGLLVVLQAMDTGGKDGTVRHVFSGIDPHGLRVHSLKGPTAEELRHDFLWRIHEKIPGRGEIGVLNRSHYEDIVAVRVKKLAAKEVWERRYQHIANFEQMLVDEGLVIVKIYLHINRTEQRRRLQERLDNPRKHWKFHPDDVNDREQWDEFIKAYEDVISRTSTEAAPWYIVPANKKWYRNLVVAQLLRDTLLKLDSKWPEPRYDVKKVVLK